tara:strand:+ start:1111 stop:1797 length:687 start_codon:yes stop_codon:yes gene_type:complete
MAEFWRNASQEPKRAYRWYVSFTNLGSTPSTTNGGGGAISSGGSSLQYACKRVDRPSLSVSETEHTYLNHKFYYPGRVEWNEISISFVDVIGADGAADVFLQMLNQAGYNFPSAAGPSTSPETGAGTGVDLNLMTLGKQAMVDQLGDVAIVLVNANGLEVERWTLHNAFFKSVRLSGLDYGSDEMLTVDTSIRYDWATYVRSNGPAGDIDDSDRSQVITNYGPTGIWK